MMAMEIERHLKKKQSVVTTIKQALAYILDVMILTDLAEKDGDPIIFHSHCEHCDFFELEPYYFRKQFDKLLTSMFKTVPVQVIMLALQTEHPDVRELEAQTVPLTIMCDFKDEQYTWG